MESKERGTPADILAGFEDLFGAQCFEGIKSIDRNFEGNFLLIESSARMYSFNSNDVVEEEVLEGGRVKVMMRKGCSGMTTSPFQVGTDHSSLLSYSENSPPPERSQDDSVVFATPEDSLALGSPDALARTLAGVAANWTKTCTLGDDESNDCAHFLSDAFIKAGFTELRKVSADPSIKEWCDWNDAKKDDGARPIRAKEMWEWFKRMAVTTKRTKPSNEGFWAVFQWDPSYPGGHVLLYDSNTTKIFGTDVFWQWKDQFFYQW